MWLLGSVERIFFKYFPQKRGSIRTLELIAGTWLMGIPCVRIYPL